MIRAKCNKKEAECIAMEKKLKEVTKSLEATLADKSEVINRLARNLEESQMRCEQLMSSQAGQENCELRMQLSGERSEKEDLKEKISSLQKTVEMLQTDICSYEAATQLGFLSSENIKESDSIVQLGIAGGIHSVAGGLDSKSDVNVKLREELKRSLIGQRMKRDEIRRLQMELESRDLQIQEMQLQESKYLAEAESFKVQTQKLLHHLRKDAENNIADPKSRCIALEKELMSLKEWNIKLKENIEALEYENKRLEKENESLSTENTNFYSKIKEISKVKEKEKQDAIDQFQNEYLKFHDQSLARVKAEKNEPLEKEINELRKQLEAAHKEADEAKRVCVELCSNKNTSSGMEGGDSDLINSLKKQLQQEKEEFSKFRENYNTLVKQKCEALQKENSQVIQKMEERSRGLYEKKVAEEIDKAKKECMKELELHYKAQMEKLRKEVEKEMLAKQKSLVDADVAKTRSQAMENSTSKKDTDEKVSELFKECCRLREELDAKQRFCDEEIERIKGEAEKNNLEKLRENQREIEERLGNEFREQLKKAEATRDHAAKMLKEQLEAEQNAFLEKYEEKLHEYSLKVKSHSTRTIGTSPPDDLLLKMENTIAKDDLEKILKEKEIAMEERLLKEVEEAERKGRLEAESLYSGNLDVFRKLMEAKTLQVEEVRAAMALEKSRLKAALIDARADAAEVKAKEEAGRELIKLREGEMTTLKLQVSQLTKELKELTDQATNEKDAMAETMARWASDVQVMKAARRNENRKLVQIYKNYQEMKKTVGKYKVYLGNKDKQLKNDHKQLVENFTSALNMIDKRMKEVCINQDSHTAERLAAIEASFDKKSEKLVHKLKLLKSELSV
ncbi:uncharacterized protein [Hetaerina americana]|uniref:uncharacterized protein isoform X2 n=1 Tax=Hetaerina americana TaxID=62018 RepID=UPI003A7F6230